MNAPELLTPTLELIPVTSIRPSGTHIQILRRQHFDPEKLLELTASIQSQGVLQPVLVRPVEASGTVKFEIVAGERRWLAAGRAGLAHIPANVRDMSDEQVLEAQLIENLQREDLRPLEEAEGYKELMAIKQIDADEVAALIGKSRSYVYARTKLRDLCPAAREALAAGKVDASKALLIARFAGDVVQQRALKLVMESNWRGEQISYKAAVEALREKFMIPLTAAPFLIDDDSLAREIPIRKTGLFERSPLPACLECPQFSGNDSELRAELGPDAHVCTNRECYDAKVACIALKRRKAAEAAGATIVTGDAAKKIIPGRDKLVGHVDLDSVCHYDECPDPAPIQAKGESDELFEQRLDAWQARTENWNERSYRQLLVDAKLPVVLVEDPKTKQVRELVPIKSARAALAKEADIKLPGYVGQVPPKRQAVDYKAQQAKYEEECERQREREEREAAYRLRLLNAIADKCAGPLKREDLVDVADALAEHWRVSEGLKLYFKGKIPEPGQLKDAELGKFIRLALVAETVGGHGSPGPLLAMAKRYKVDPAKIKKQIANEEKAKAAAPAAGDKKPAAKKGGKK